MDTTLRVVNCPCCKRMLYALGLDKTDAGATWQITKDSPEIQQDGEGYFAKCGNCSKRIAIEKVSAQGADRWMVSARQPCNRTLP